MKHLLIVFTIVFSGSIQGQEKNITTFKVGKARYIIKNMAAINTSLPDYGTSFNGVLKNHIVYSATDTSGWTNQLF